MPVSRCLGLLGSFDNVLLLVMSSSVVDEKEALDVIVVFWRGAVAKNNKMLVPSKALICVARSDIFLSFKVVKKKEKL